MDIIWGLSYLILIAQVIVLKHGSYMQLPWFDAPSTDLNRSLVAIFDYIPSQNNVALKPLDGGYFWPWEWFGWESINGKNKTFLVGGFNHLEK